MQQNPTLPSLLEDVCRPGEVTVVTVTGQAGAGKTERATPALMQAAELAGIPHVSLGLDAFFKLSSAGRKVWIEEGKALGDKELQFRQDQMNWWDFDRLSHVLGQIRRRESVHMTHVYNRADKGELTGEIRIEPVDGTLLVLLEGVATAHLNGGSVQFVLYTHAPSAQRMQRLQARDVHRKGPEVEERFRITQAFEVPYFQDHWSRINMFLDNSGDSLILVDELDPKHALG